MIATTTLYLLSRLTKTTYMTNNSLPNAAAWQPSAPAERPNIRITYCIYTKYKHFGDVYKEMGRGGGV
jgi:hypothetical protein